MEMVCFFSETIVMKRANTTHYFLGALKKAFDTETLCVALAECMWPKRQ